MFKTSRPANPRILLHRILLRLLDFFVFQLIKQVNQPPHKKKMMTCVCFLGACFFWWPCLKKNMGFVWFKISRFFHGFQPGVPASWTATSSCHGGLGFFGFPKFWVDGHRPMATSNIAVQFTQGSWLMIHPWKSSKTERSTKTSVPQIGHNELKGGKEVGFTLFLEV